MIAIDLSDPAAPAVTGESGDGVFSADTLPPASHLQPIDGDRLLLASVSFEVDADLRRDRISLYDTSGATPVLLARVEVTVEHDGWFFTHYDVSAFNYAPATGLLTVTQHGGRETVRATLELLAVGQGELTHRGTIDHSSFFNDGSSAADAAPPRPRRSVFLGDFVYTLSTRALTVHALTDLSTPVAAFERPPDPDPYWWW